MDNQNVMLGCVLWYQSLNLSTGEGLFYSWRVEDGTHSGETEQRYGGPWPQRMRRHSPKLEYQQMAAIVYVSSSPT